MAPVYFSWKWGHICLMDTFHFFTSKCLNGMVNYYTQEVWLLCTASEFTLRLIIHVQKNVCKIPECQNSASTIFSIQLDNVDILYYVSPSNEGRHIVLVWFFLPLLLSKACPDHNFFVFPNTCRSIIFGMWMHDHKTVCHVP